MNEYDWSSKNWNNEKMKMWDKEWNKEEWPIERWPFQQAPHLPNPYVSKKHVMYKLTPKKGLLIFHIAVGQLPPNKAEEFVLKMKTAIEEDLKETKKIIDIVFLPARSDFTKTEYIQY